MEIVSLLVILLIVVLAILLFRASRNPAQKSGNSTTIIPSRNSSNNSSHGHYGPISAFDKYKRQVAQELYSASKGLPGMLAVSYEDVRLLVPIVEDDVKSGFSDSKPPISPAVVANYILGSYLSVIFTQAVSTENPEIPRETAVQFGHFTKDVFNSLFDHQIFIRNLSSYRITMDDLIYAVYVMFTENTESQKIVDYLEVFNEYISLHDYQHLVEEELQARNVPVKDLMPGLFVKIKRAYYFGLSNSGTFLPDIIPPEVFAQKFADKYFEILNDNLKSRGLKPENTSPKAYSSKGASGIQSY